MLQRSSFCNTGLTGERQLLPGVHLLGVELKVGSLLQGFCASFLVTVRILCSLRFVIEWTLFWAVRVISVCDFSIYLMPVPCCIASPTIALLAVLLLLVVLLLCCASYHPSVFVASLALLPILIVVVDPAEVSHVCSLTSCRTSVCLSCSSTYWGFGLLPPIFFSSQVTPRHAASQVLPEPSVGCPSACCTVAGMLLLGI